MVTDLLLQILDSPSSSQVLPIPNGTRRTRFLAASGTNPKGLPRGLTRVPRGMGNMRASRAATDPTGAERPPHLRVRTRTPHIRRVMFRITGTNASPPKPLEESIDPVSSSMRRIITFFVAQQQLSAITTRAIQKS